MAGNDGSEGRYASPPCIAGEIAPDYFDPLGVDPEQARDVARWRRAERVRLRAERQALSVEVRGAVGAALSGHLRDILADQFADMRERVFSAYWPIKGEPDLRPLMADLHATGVRVALPLVEVKQAPLVFRRWTPETYMVRGDWNIAQRKSARICPRDDRVTGFTQTATHQVKITWQCPSAVRSGGDGMVTTTEAASKPGCIV